MTYYQSKEWGERLSQRETKETGEISSVFLNVCTEGSLKPKNKRPHSLINILGSTNSFQPNSPEEPTSVGWRVVGSAVGSMGGKVKCPVSVRRRTVGFRDVPLWLDSRRLAFLNCSGLSEMGRLCRCFDHDIIKVQSTAFLRFVL